jgi:hypothetical protein
MLLGSTDNSVDARNFVDLDRQFVRLSNTADPEDAASDSYILWAYRLGSGKLDWNGLLKKQAVVILGEPGSGKSWELERRARELSDAGEFAFFIRLEDLIHRPLRVALGRETQVFDRWTAGQRPAFFFLDSVDESKLNKAEDFYVALKHFRDALPVGFAARTNIFLSSRISEWHHETDGAHVRECFGLPGRVEKGAEDEDGATTKPSKDADLLVVQIAPLDRERVATFARAKGLANVDDFLKALDHTHAWEFARRPIDVLALADFWQQNQRIGSLTELIEFDLGRKLRERRSHVSDPLSDADARAGAEALAAATVFCGQANIKISDENLTGDGLDGRICVPENWTNDQFDVLLTRPVFDGASYGRVRFHHRRVREYLAARWVAARMQAGCSNAELEALFFERISGRRIIRASRAPVAAWLCSGGEPYNAAMRSWVLDAEPDLNLRFGDPQALPLDYKRAILTKLVEQARSRQYLWLETDHDALSRLADPALAPDIEEIIRDRSLAFDLRIAMIGIVRHGRLVGCQSVILDLVASLSEPDDIKMCAVAALRELNDNASLSRLATIVAPLPKLLTGLTDLLIDALFPTWLNVDGLVSILRKTYGRDGDRPELTWQMTRRLKPAPQVDQACPLLAALLPLAQTMPVLPADPGELSVSQEFAWLLPLMLDVLTVILSKRVLTHEETTDVSVALALIGMQRHQSEAWNENKPTLNELTFQHPAVRREYFWATIRRRRAEGLTENVMHWYSFFFQYANPKDQAVRDLNWLIADLSAFSAEADRVVALRLATQLYNEIGRPWKIRRRIRRAMGNHAMLRAIFRELDRVGRLRPLLRNYYRLGQALQRRQWQGRAVYGRVRSALNLAKFRFYLWRRRSRIASGEHFNVISFLVHEADPKNRSRWTVSEWDNLAEKYGRPVVKATRQGGKKFWRTFTPLLPHENKDPNRVPHGLIVGLTGLHAAWVDGELDFCAMPDTDVQLAMRYALNEINGFPLWLSALTEKRSEMVGRVFAECISHEWNYSSDLPHGPESLQRFAWTDGPVLPAVQTTVLSKLAEGDPPNIRVLNLALTLLMNQTSPPLAELELFARARVINPATASGQIALWFIVWLQINPTAAIDAWETSICRRADADQIMVSVCANLQDRHIGHGPRLNQPRFLTVGAIRRLLPIVYAHVRRDDDLHRENHGAYTPEARDFAQEFRGALVRQLADSPDPTAAEALEELASLPAFAQQRDYLIHLHDEQWKKQADDIRWLPRDVREFAHEHETEPQTDRDLFRVVLKRLSDIKNDVERSDLGLRTNLREGDREALLRIWLAQELMRRSKHRYTVPQEAVIDQNERPDIRIENPHTDAVSLEIKWADSWSLNDLLDALEKQLLGQYLRAHNSRHGALVIGMIGNSQRSWRSPDGTNLNFSEVLSVLNEKAAELMRAHPEVKKLSVIGIDFRPPQTARGQKAESDQTAPQARQ